MRPNWKEQPSQQSLVGKVGDNLFTLINAAAYPPCKHQVVLNVDQYDDCVLVQSFPSRMVCGKCRFVGADVRLWKEQPPQPSLTGKVFS